MQLRGFKLPNIGGVAQGELVVGDKVVHVKVKRTEAGMNVLDAINQRSLQLFGINMDTRTISAKAPARWVEHIIKTANLEPEVAQP
jgi:hypothetical protein